VDAYVGGDVIQSNDENHELARGKVDDGTWRVDAERGLVYGMRGEPFRRRNSWGYIQVKWRDSMNWRRERSVLAHRVIWESVHGALTQGLTINHRNGDKTDNRIANLEAVTMRENNVHALATGLRQVVRGEDVPHARLNEASVREIRRRCLTERVCDLAREYGVAYWTIADVKHRRSWQHVA
jgi:hypothetical protein